MNLPSADISMPADRAPSLVNNLVSGPRLGDPEIESAVEAREIVELLAIRGEQPVRSRRRVNGEPALPLREILPVDGDIGLRGIRGCLVFVAVRLLLLGGLVLRFLHERQLFLGEVEAIPCGAREEHRVDIATHDAASLGASAFAVRSPDHRLATEYPLGLAVVVAALREVVQLPVAGRRDQPDLWREHSVLVAELHEKPLAVR
jgi:hypothetical protein